MSMAIHSTLYWVQPHQHKRYFELRDGDRKLASVEYGNFFSWDAVGFTGEKRWTLKRKGFFKSYTVIIDLATGSEVAEFKSHWGGKGDLIFCDGRTFKWKHEGFLHSRWHLMTEDAEELLIFSIPSRKIIDSLKAQAVMDVSGSMDDKTLPLLAVITWYNLYIIWSMAMS